MPHDLDTEAIGEPLTDDEVRALGWEPTPNGWYPSNPDTSNPVESNPVASNPVDADPPDPWGRPAPCAGRATDG